MIVRREPFLGGVVALALLAGLAACDRSSPPDGRAGASGGASNNLDDEARQLEALADAQAENAAANASEASGNAAARAPSGKARSGR